MIKLELDKKSLKVFDETKKEIDDGTLKGVRKAMFYAEGQAKNSFGKPGNLRVRSGRLRSSIFSNVRKDGTDVIGEIGSNVYYARLHELGTKRLPARPFLQPAIRDNIDKIQQIIIDSINKEVK